MIVCEKVSRLKNYGAYAIWNDLIQRRNGHVKLQLRTFKKNKKTRSGGHSSQELLTRPFDTLWKVVRGLQATMRIWQTRLTKTVVMVWPSAGATITFVIGNLFNEFSRTRKRSKRQWWKFCHLLTVLSPLSFALKEDLANARKENRKMGRPTGTLRDIDT